MSKSTERMDALRESFVQAQTEFNTKIKTLLKEETDRLFVKFPTAQSISWTQYTPYFQDGDECVFGAYIDQLTVQAVGEEEGVEIEPEGINYEDRVVRMRNYDYNTRQSTTTTRPATELELFARQFYKLLRSAGNDALKAAYGDHTTVIISREGTELEEYQHD